MLIKKDKIIAKVNTLKVDMDFPIKKQFFEKEFENKILVTPAFLSFIPMTCPNAIDRSAPIKTIYIIIFLMIMRGSFENGIAGTG